MTHRPASRQRFSRGALFALTLLAIEFLDEFVFGAREAAWPLIRDDLALSYAQVGILLGVPSVVANLVEPLLAVLGDIWKRRVIVLAGGVFFVAALLLTSVSDSYGFLLASFVLLYPASGAFVSLSQATLMDLDPARHEQNMASWTFAGSLGVVAGPLALAAASALLIGWRGIFAAFAGLSALLLLLVWRMPFVQGRRAGQDGPRLSLAAFIGGLGDVLAAIRRRDVLRWLVLLEFSDLMLDVLLGFLALYMVDVGGATVAQASIAVAIWSGAGLVGDFLLIPLLERAPGLAYLRVSIVLKLLLYPAFLLLPGLGAKYLLLALLGLFNVGWYAILQAQLYSALPGQSGTALAAKNVTGLIGGLIPLGVGLVAGWAGLGAAMWLLLLGPVALLVGLPRKT